MIFFTKVYQMWERWSGGKTQDSGSRGPGSESHPDRWIFLAENSSSPRCINGYPDRAVFVQV